MRPLTPDEVSGRLLPDLLWVFGGALGFSRRSSRVVGFADTVKRHAGYPGFTAFGAFEPRGRLVGFSYGYTSQPGGRSSKECSRYSRRQWGREL